MDSTTLIGITASACTAFFSLPQLIKIIKEKNGQSVSKGMLITLLIGLVLWIIYGIARNDWIIIISNTLSFIINSLNLIMSIKYRGAGSAHKQNYT